MLKCLEVQQFALIENLQVEFAEGLSLLTGETGSGKSILVDALSLLLGEKAHGEMIRTGAEKAVVTGLFELADPALRARLEAAGLEHAADELIIKREVSQSGKGRAFINSQMVSVGFLKEIARFLADIHGQNEQQTLSESDSQLAFVDALADAEAPVAEVRELYAHWQDVLQQMARLQNSEQERLRNMDWLRFQLDEIEKVKLKDPEEDESLAAEHALLANADKLFQLSSQAYAGLYEAENSASATIKQASRQVEELSRVDPRCAAFLEQLQAARIAVDDVALSLREYSLRIEADPKRLEQVEARLAEIERLKRKYGKTVKEILAFHDRSKRDLASLLTADENLAQLGKDRLSAASRYRDAAQLLSEKRKAAARVLEKTVAKELAELAMQRCRFRVAFSKTRAEPGIDGGLPAAWETAAGIDEVEFLLSPNPGEDLKPLVKIASGGEISRIMLALKSVRTLDGRGKCLVFDEVDSGIGGQTADVIGQKLKRLSQKNQVICVTHLPQIASYADRHYFIEKRVEKGRTVTRVALLQHQDRVQEIARMISGERKTESVLKHAAEMLKDSRR
ncbi:MAG: DNA repair protein RecN [Acidobacteria bacterium]|nr:DNA repair protein RecN [Acidobacteriota bacterium]MCI0723460.1 DNA repair protein RecN [Acidobacteriota bacterium]